MTKRNSCPPKLTTLEKQRARAPEELGRQLFIELAMKSIRLASQSLDAEAAADLYAGFILAAGGAMVADFGLGSGYDLIEAGQTILTRVVDHCELPRLQ